MKGEVMPSRYVFASLAFGSLLLNPACNDDEPNGPTGGAGGMAHAGGQATSGGTAGGASDSGGTAGGASDSGGTGAGAGNQVCGGVTCSSGEYCCNESCGICVRPGGTCIMLLCG
jgi:hypothetical protein